MAPHAVHSREDFTMSDERIVDLHEFTTRQMRDVMGRFCTGVTIIAAVVDGVPQGFAAQSFVALSLEPPQILICPMKTSRSWAKIEPAGSFCVSILAEDQEDVSSNFGGKAEDKFANIDWEPNLHGNPRISGAVGYVDCTISHVIDGGDHWIIVARVDGLGEPVDDQRPLLFYRGAYLEIEPGVIEPEPEHESLENFLTALDRDAWY